MPADDTVTSDLVNPYELKDSDGYMWLKGSLHTHTTNSDGLEEPQDRLDQYVAKGYDYMCLSDHHKITPVDSVKAPNDFVLIEGAELHPHNPFGGRQHHLLCLDIHEDMDAETMPPQHVIDHVNEQGGAVWLAHPHWLSVNIMRDVLPLKGLAGIEVFNTTCRRHARGESTAQWDDWMDQTNRLIPALANDDAHGQDADPNGDTYQGWTMLRVKERTAAAAMEAMNTGASYGSTGPDIHDIKFEYMEDEPSGAKFFEVTIKHSEARRVHAINDRTGSEYWEKGKTFEECKWHIAASKWVRFEVIDPDGYKAWSNPIDLTGLRGDV